MPEVDPPTLVWKGFPRSYHWWPVRTGAVFHIFYLCHPPFSMALMVGQQVAQGPLYVLQPGLQGQDLPL